MVEHLRRKNLGAAAEATMEVGRLNYLLGRRADGVQKFIEAIEQNEARDQSYIDALSFLVQRGESDAALDIYRRALSQPSRTVSEYVKVYASLWIVDLTRRGSKTPEPSRRGLPAHAGRPPLHLRPQRVVAWYVPLARYALGRITYEQLAAAGRHRRASAPSCTSTKPCAGWPTAAATTPTPCGTRSSRPGCSSSSSSTWPPATCAPAPPPRRARRRHSDAETI